jgi:hypothetical protein
MSTVFILPLVLAFSPAAVWALRVGGLRWLGLLCALTLLAVLLLALLLSTVYSVPSAWRLVLYFFGACGAFDTVGHRLFHVVDWLREDTPASANYGVC